MLATGLPWPETPFLAEGSGPAVYMIDVTTPPPADAGTSTDAGRGDSGGGNAGDGAGGAGPDGSDVDGGSWASDTPTGGSSGGCVVATGAAGDGVAWGLGLAVCVLARVRRRR
jgi:hypothetical protein